MLSALHAEFQKAHRRHDLAICLVVPVVVFLWPGRLTSTDPEALARRNRCNSVEEMYAAIGYGGLQISRCLLYTSRCV